MVYKDTHKTKDGRCYYFQVMVNGKRFHSPKYLTSKEAKEEEAKYLLNHKKVSKVLFQVVASNFFDEVKQIRKLSTYQTYIEVYNKHICPFFVDYDLNSINILELKNFREKCLKMNYSTRYLNKINNVLNLILDYASVNYGYTNLNKTLGNYQEKKDKITTNKIRYMTYDDYLKFISVIDELEWRTFFMFLYLTGMRLGEVLALTFNDIKDDTIVVNKTLYTKIKGTYTITSTKNNLNRIVKMDKSLYKQLYEYINFMKSYTDFSNEWFLFGGSRYLPPTTINRYKHKYFELSGVKEITIHEFRHSHVSLLINQYLKNGNTDANLFFLRMSSRMGHSVDVMTRTYMHLFPQSQDTIVDILNNL
jgi:integrase